MQDAKRPNDPFANLRSNKRLNRFTYRRQDKVGVQRSLYCLVHNLEKFAHLSRKYGRRARAAARQAASVAS